MGDHLTLARFPHAVALDRLGEDDRRRASMFGRRLIRGIDFYRVMAATGQRPNSIVAPVRDHSGRLRIAAEKMLPNIGAVLRFEILVLAVDAFHHQLTQLAVLIL